METLFPREWIRNDVRSGMCDTNTHYPVLEGKNIVQQMKSNPHFYVVMDKGNFGKGTDVYVQKPDA